MSDDRLGPWLKGYPGARPPIARADLAAQRWNVLAGDLPLPLAVLRSSALDHNIAWMQGFAAARGVQLAPHGKTTMSPQLFARQLAAGAWGITFASVFQLRTGVVEAGVRRALIANQVQQRADLDALAGLLAAYGDLQVAFLVDSTAQLALIEAWHAQTPRAPVLDVLLEIGVPGGRTGVRDHDAAVALARALRASTAVRLVGIECYEGLQASGDSARDEAHVDALLQRVARVAEALDGEDLFEAGEVIVSAGGSAVFDLVAARLPLALTRPVRPLLRSGCYVTHDHGHYQRYVSAVNRRCGIVDGLRGALELWTEVQSVPEPGLALLSAGRRDVGFDAGLPLPLHHARSGARACEPADAAWQVSALNDQHAYLRLGGGARAVAVGDRIALGIQHPCTTFDKWHWMPIVDDDYTVVDAVTIRF
ncbi:MAG: alanine racemase [Burkholderiaceae bacterium]